MIAAEGRTFHPGNPMIVAEISCNHMGCHGKAKELVTAAARAGADAVKFQTFEASDMTAPLETGPYVLTSGPWKGRALWDLYDEVRTPWNWIPSLYEHARSLELIPFCSVFHPKVIPNLEGLGTEIYKVASPEAEWDELKHALEATGKQLIVSDGMTYNLSGWDAVILRCVSEYPAKQLDYGFRNRPERWGLSTHSTDPILWTIAAALGAEVIEAHLMLEDTMPPDYHHSFIPSGFRKAAWDARDAARIAHQSRKPPIDAEFRRRWVYAKNLPAGHRLREEDFAILRAREGMPASTHEAHLPEVLEEPVDQWDPVL